LPELLQSARPSVTISGWTWPTSLLHLDCQEAADLISHLTDTPSNTLWNSAGAEFTIDKVGDQVLANMDAILRASFLTAIVSGVSSDIDVIVCDTSLCSVEAGAVAQQKKDIKAQILLNRDCLWWLKADHTLLADDDEPNILLSRNTRPLNKDSDNYYVGNHYLVSVRGSFDSLERVKLLCIRTKRLVAVYRVSSGHLMLSSSFQNLQSLLQNNALQKSELLQSVVVSVEAPLTDHESSHKTADLVIRSWKATIQHVTSTQVTAHNKHKNICMIIIAAFKRSFWLKCFGQAFWTQLLLGLAYNYFLLVCFEDLAESIIVGTTNTRQAAATTQHACLLPCTVLFSSESLLR
jgi:hypothetical protein